MTVAAKSGLVVHAAADGSRVSALSLTSGRRVWTFVPEALTGARSGVFVQKTGSGERVVLARQGRTVDRGLGVPRSTITIDVLPAVATGTTTALRHFVLTPPHDTAVSFTATDSGFLVGPVTDGVHETAVMIDSGAGTENTVRTKRVTVTGCATASCTVRSAPAFTTSRGTVSVFQQQDGCDPWDGNATPCTYGFQVGDTWTSTGVAPRGMHVGIPLAATAQYLVAAWHTSDIRSDPPALSTTKTTTLAVHNLSTGTIKARVACASSDALTLQPGSAQSSTRLSPNGRFLVSGQAGFDLTTGHGHCFTATAAVKGIDLTSVADDGTAYGLLHTDDGTAATSLYGRLPVVQDAADTPGRVPARVNLRTGVSEALSEGSEVPVYVAADGRGVFRTRDVIAVYPAS
ncbi:MAG TPA: hypothetical protein VIU15_13440 [Streptomyces sp.]